MTDSTRHGRESGDFPSPRARRRFNSRERVALYLAAGGACARCGTVLTDGWHGDHIEPHVAGGATDVTNGQALCPTCNLTKGASRMGWTGPELREWQREALNDYIGTNAPDFLAVATPGAGKTTFALRLASDLLDSGVVERVVVVVPTEHLKVQWANAAHRCGLNLDPTTQNSDGLENRSDYRGAALTYAQVASQPALHRHGVGRWRTLVILDEIHHAGEDKAWGDAVREAFDSAVRRLCLSGTPFRSDDNPIPFVTYDESGRSRADFTYGYGRAIRDDVCRQVDFHFYDGEMRWMDAGVVTSTANLSAELARGDQSAVMDTALDAQTGWMRGVLQVANRALGELREEVPDAGGLVIAYRGAHARAYAAILREITGEEPTVVLSEDGREANAGIEAFSRSNGRWLIAVRMVSEGVDVPRLAVGVYATKTKTEMFFRQAVGRFVRRGPDEEHSALVFAPALPGLRVMAAQIELEIQHEIDREREEYDTAVREQVGEQLGLPLPAVPLSASAPTFDRAIHGGLEYNAGENEQAMAMLKKYSFPSSMLAQMRHLVREEFSTDSSAVVVVDTPAPAEPTYKLAKTLRGKLFNLARRIAMLEQAEHAYIQTEVNQAMGVRQRAKATVQQLEAGIAYAQKRLGDR